MKRKLIILISFILFLLIFLLYKLDLLNNIDNSVYNFIIGIKSRNMTSIMKIITFFASTKFIIFILLLLLLLSIKYKKIPILINIVVIIEILINNLVKIIVRRDRPKLINLVTEKSFSFPSGHTMVSVTLYGFIIYLILKSNINKKLKYLLISLLSVLTILIMISRIYLGAHFFSDVFGGLCLALAYLITTIDIIERKKLL